MKTDLIKTLIGRVEQTPTGNFIIVTKQGDLWLDDEFQSLEGYIVKITFEKVED